jgi:DNA-binding response OmpR family regulator
MKPKILIVEDEELVRSSLADVLLADGYAVETAANGQAALDRLGQENFDLILLDLILPGVDGMEVMRSAARLAPDTKILVLTGHGTLETAVEALRQGAHDYILKPASAHVILSSVARGLVKRTEQQQRRMLLEQIDSSLQRLKTVERVEAPQPAEAEVYMLDESVMLDLNRRELWRGNLKVGLTPTEARLVKIFVENRGRVLSHRELVFLVQGYEVSDLQAPEVLRPLVSRLRRKLSPFPNGENWVTNVRGTGY